MAVCSFLGHRELYDADADIRLQAVVDQLVSENETVEFLLHSFGDFYNQCLLATLKARSRNPHKVTITYIADPVQISYMKTYHVCIPLCIFDKIKIFHIEDSKKKNHSIWHKESLHQVAKSSTHIVTYVYRRLCEPVNRLLDFVRGKRLETIPIESEKTEQALCSLAAQLSEREQFVLKKIEERETHRKLAGTLGVAPSMVSQIKNHAGRKIREKLRRQYYIARAQKNQMRSCCICSIGEVTDTKLRRYKELIDFLISEYNVRNFYVEYVYPHSNTISAFVRDLAQSKPVHITVVTDCDEYLEPILEPHDVISNLQTAYDTLEYIVRLDYRGLAYILGFYSDMIDRSDFCICDLSSNICPDVIEEYIAQKDQVVLLNIAEQDENWKGSCGVTTV